ncbi:hypothetical protein [uncultured Helicobacter sp.]|uniref:hypothetical protein n=1 Tax=uncultured Helicobacter sp. TaxID=175537 RepID=UPI00374E540B
MLTRYILVGCLATAIFYVVANALALFCGTYIATFMGNLTSFVFGYFAQMKFAFGVQAKHSVMLPRYIALLCLIFVYGQIVTFFGQSFSYVLVSLCIALSVPLFSYPLQRFWVFKEVGDSKTSLGGGENRLPKRQHLVYFHWLFYSLFYHTYLACFLSKDTRALPLFGIALMCAYRFSVFCVYCALLISLRLRLIPTTRLHNPRFISISFSYQIRILAYLTHKEF